MDIILLKDVDTLGTAGDIVNVKPGFARNFLFPRRLALRASKRNLAIADERKRNSEKRLKHDAKINHELADQLKDLEMTFEVQVGEEEKMFGAVTTNDIHKNWKKKVLFLSVTASSCRNPSNHLVFIMYRYACLKI